MASWLSIIHSNIVALNTSKLFAGIVMITLNMGSRVIPIEFSQSLERLLKEWLNVYILVFAMAWLGTRDIYTAIGLCFGFLLFSSYLFNTESHLCIIPEKHRVRLLAALDKNKDGEISDVELTNALAIVEKANKQKERTLRNQMFSQYGNFTSSTL